MAFSSNRPKRYSKKIRTGIDNGQEERDYPKRAIEIYVFKYKPFSIIGS
jgi:hypothetical protein